MKIINNDPLEIKKEINLLRNDFLSLNYPENEHNSLIKSAKFILFFKILSCRREESNFYINIVYDLLSALVSIINNQDRYFHLSIRSSIEQMARINLNRNISEKKSCMIHITDFEYLKNNGHCEAQQHWIKLYENYKNACLYVHGSPDSGIDFIATYNDLKNNKVKLNLKKFIKHLNAVCFHLINISIIHDGDLIRDIFWRNNSDLIYLLGKKLYDQLFNNRIEKHD